MHACARKQQTQVVMVRVYIYYHEIIVTTTIMYLSDEKTGVILYSGLEAAISVWHDHCNCTCTVHAT